MGASPSMPIFTSAFIADTAHLTAEQTGAYLLLLMAAWRSPQCRLPDDDAAIARMLRVSARRWASMKEPVLAFWVLEDGHWVPRYEFAPHIDALSHPCRWITGSWAVVRAGVLSRDGEVCTYCGSVEGPFDIDHIRPRSRGGTNAAENLCVACARCNRSKGAKLVAEWL